MKTIIHYLTLAAGAVLFASCGPQLTATVPMSSAVPSRGDGSLAGTIHSQVNAHRSAVGSAPLPRHAGLDRLAREHSEFMRLNRGKFKLGGSSNLSHFGFEERVLSAQRLMGMSSVAENIATCSGGFSNPAGTLVKAWKNSSGHAKNMKGGWDATGVGAVVDSDGTVFATQIFASKDRSHMSTVERMKQF
jgi:uncharacterized protein YkwD